MKITLDFFRNCDILFPVSERNTNEINEMNNEINKTEETNETTVLVSCCGCNEELRISQEEADQWTDTDWFQCHECE